MKTRPAKKRTLRRLAVPLADRAATRPARGAAQRLRGFTLSIRGSAGASHHPFIRFHLHRAWKLIPGAPSELSIAIVNDRTISRLHERFMGIAGPTDVLTFPIDVAPDGGVIFGEVVVCVPEARRQAKARGVELKHELLLYALHGMLHLSGFDDRNDRGFRSMHAKEDEILTRLGVGAVFHPPPGQRCAAKAAGARG